MTWTTQPPTTDGWYWWRAGPAAKPIVCKVFDANSGWVRDTLTARDGEWSGPLIPPTDEPCQPNESAEMSPEELAEFDRLYAGGGE